MKNAVGVSVMRACDAAEIGRGTSELTLMARAGEAIYRSCPWQGRVAIVCGSGNNGGDGFVLAGLLRENGIACRVLLLSEKQSAGSRYYLDRCRADGVEIRAFTGADDLSDCTEIVDCIFGTGFHGNAEGIAADAIRAINASGKTVISVDINSGLNGDNGMTSLCVDSDLTVAIGALKTGHFLGEAKDHIKRLTCVDIGIPVPVDGIGLCEPHDFSSILRPRKQFSHKGDYGYIAILGGCAEYSGAVKLANLSASALRSGCGVSQLAVPASVSASIAPYLLESTLLPLPDDGGHIRFDPALLDRHLSRMAAIAVGMGWGTSPENEKILRHFLQNYAIPLVIDADGLNTLSRMDDRDELLTKTKCSVVLTPHLKEFERLSGIPIPKILEDPVTAAKAYASERHVVLLLKGCTTVVTDGEKVLLVDRGCAGMATAGSGDVLSGILAGLHGYNAVSVLSVACGAFIAGVAGELAGREKNAISTVASDTVAKIPDAISQMMK